MQPTLNLRDTSLLAYPTVRRCVRCQRQRERTYAHEGTPTL
jgi:RNA polymerase-binding transcription factor DksA